MPFARGARPSPRHKLCGATPFLKAAPLPLNFGVVPPQLSYWGNNQDGDCVSADEYFAKAAYSVQCGLPELFGTEQECIAFARQHGYLNGATLTDVMDTMAQVGAQFGGQTYKDGPYKSVDYSNLALIAGALQVGPVKIAIDANALPSGAGNGSGWHAFGGSPGQYPNTDHCIAICGQGTAAYCFGLLKAPVPAGVDPNKADCLMIFTWSGIGVVDHAWLMSTCTEAWVRNPTTVGQTPSPGPNPTPTPPPAPVQVVTIPNQTIHVPVFGGNVTVPGGTFQVTSHQGGPYVQGNFLSLLLKVAPIVIADIAAGKGLAQIIADVEAALVTPSAPQKLTPEQWQQIIAFVMQLIALFGHH